MLRSCAATERATHVRHSLETALCAEKRSHIPFAFIKTWRNNRKSLKKIINGNHGRNDHGNDVSISAVLNKIVSWPGTQSLVIIDNQTLSINFVSRVVLSTTLEYPGIDHYYRSGDMGEPCRVPITRRPRATATATATARDRDRARPYLQIDNNDR